MPLDSLYPRPATVCHMLGLTLLNVLKISAVNLKPILLHNERATLHVQLARART